MNAHMRRYLDDEQGSDEHDRTQPETTTTGKIKAAVLDRRQTEKQRGKAITKYHRDHAKYAKRNTD